MDNEEIIEELIEEEIEDEIEEGAVLDDNPVGLFSTEISSGEYDLQILEELQKSNDNWQLFLDSYTVDFSNNISLIPPSEFTVSNNGTIQWGTSNPSSGFICVFPVDSYKFYDITFVPSQTYCQAFIGFLDHYPTIEDNGLRFSSLRQILSANVGETYNYTYSGYQGYLVVRVTYAQGSVNEYWTGLESYTLSEIGNAITSVDNKVDGLDTIVTIETSLLLVTLFTFFLSAVRKFGKKVNRKGDL